MKTFAVIFTFDTVEEAETKEQAIEQAEEFFETSLGVGGFKHRASHSNIYAEELHSPHNRIWKRILSNINKTGEYQ